MKKSKSKRIISAILCAAALTGALTFTACNKGDESDGGEQTEHVPVTTVANEEEWRNAFKNLFNVKSLHVKNVFKVNGVVQYEFGAFPNCDCYFDNENSKYLSEWEAVASDAVSKNEGYEYYEADENAAWTYWNFIIRGDDPNSGNGISKVENNNGYEDAEDYYLSGKSEPIKQIMYDFVFNNENSSLAILRNEVCKADDVENGKFLGEFFNEFTYEDGRYVSDSLGVYAAKFFAALRFEVEIKDGIISKVTYTTNLDEAGGATYTMGFTVDGVNSTTVTTPAAARTAIDAEKTKG